jgi:hypothetical protein
VARRSPDIINEVEPKGKTIGKVVEVIERLGASARRSKLHLEFDDDENYPISSTQQHSLFRTDNYIISNQSILLQCGLRVNIFFLLHAMST